MRSPVDRHIGWRIRQRRRQVDMRQAALAAACGVSFQTIQ
jgi:DNA-binding XRE family transcriptional regulator